MKKLNRILSAVIAIIFIAAITSLPCFALTYITSPGSVSASYYTNNELLKTRINNVLNGNIGLYGNYACTTSVALPLGSYLDKSKVYYVSSNTTGNVLSGYQCFIYANAVYNHLCREWVGNGSSLSHSYIALSNLSFVSYQQFVNAGIRQGAYIRTTTNQDGSYNGNSGHSMVVIYYDKDQIVFAEGNADGYGLIRLSAMSWSEYNQKQVSGRSRKICHIIQPKASYYESMYPSSHVHSFVTGHDADHPHAEYKSCACGYKEYTGAYAQQDTCYFCAYGDPTIASALTLFKHIAGTAAIQDKYIASLDFDGGGVTISDALRLFKYVAGLSSILYA